MRAVMVCYWLALFFILMCYSTTAEPIIGIANLSTTWTVKGSEIQIGSGVQILESYSADVWFKCGFICTGNCTSFLFSVIIMRPYYEDWSQVVWSANRHHLVSDGAELSLTAAGELMLRDVDRSTVWSTNTTGKSVAGLNMTDYGNLVLFDTSNSIVWQSFDYPTDCLLLGQRLYQGQQLIPSVSSTNWTAQNGLISLRVTDKGLFAYVGSNPPQFYDSILLTNGDRTKGKRYAQYMNGNLSLIINPVDQPETSILESSIDISRATSSAQYMKLMPDGHLQVFEYSQGWVAVAGLINPMDNVVGDCSYPIACGRNALCSGNRQCSCVVPDYFRALNDRQLDLGCSEITPLTCKPTHDQELIPVKNVTSFVMVPAMERVDIETCKKACVNNCSCKAALYQYRSRFLDGFCYLHSELFTMVYIEVEKKPYNINSTAFIKVQKLRADQSTSPSASPSSTRSASRIILISTCASVAFVLGVVGFIIYITHKRRRAAEMEEELIHDIQGMPTRFAYENLKTATDNFNKKLGEGGFGAVFEGTLEDGSKIAVKCLDGLGQVKKSFVAEVESIGSIHHLNLVRLRGFCARKSQRFLVYEFMSNGSLDRWIYHGVRERVLEWKCRKKIILDVAKGLAYLHEECRQKIIHLDIKPQNILLDNDFNAKVSDFGLSKLIDRNQSEVITTMRGTPGYLAPEWLTSVITEKVDVYSFGVVLLETICARKKFDKSLPEDSWHLLDVFQKCWEQEMLLDLVDKGIEDMQSHISDFMEMMKVAAWCLQYDFTKRPSMSIVVKVLEGMMKVESSLSYNFTYSTLPNTAPEQDITTLQASLLSGPR